MKMMGRSSLALAAMLAMTASLPTVQVGTRREVDWWGDRKEPDNRGRRAEKDAIALAKAEKKRQRKAAKRAAKVGAGETAPTYQEARDEMMRLGDRYWLDPDEELTAATEGHNRY